MSLILINLCVTIFMTGVIWIIQLVHYPSFRYVDEGHWSQAHQHHVNQISRVVAPMMILELGFRVWWLYQEISYLTISATILLAVIWASTFLIQVPIHDKLESHKSEPLIDRLVKSNWIRTIAWTLSSVLLLIGYTLNL